MSKRSTRRANNEGSVYKRKKDEVWVAQYQVGYYDNDKKRRKFKTATAATKKDAEEKLRQLKEEHGQLTNSEYAEILTEKLAEKWFEDKKNPNVYDKELKRKSLDRIACTMNTHVLPVIGKIPLNEVTSRDVQTVIDNMREKELSFSSAKKAYDDMNNFFRYCVEKKGWIPESPMKGVKLCKNSFPAPKEIVSFTQAESEAIVQAATVQYKNGKPKYECGYVIPIMMETGLRVGELIGLMWKYVHLEERYIEVRQTVVMVNSHAKIGTAKDGDEKLHRVQLLQDSAKSANSIRIIPLTDKALMYFRKQKAYRYYGEEYFVFNTKSNVPKALGESNLRRAFKNILKNAGVEHNCLHALRHTFATNLNSHDANMLAISRLMGHSTVKPTLGYIDTPLENLRKAINTLEEKDDKAANNEDTAADE
jgi:integrase